MNNTLDKLKDAREAFNAYAQKEDYNYQTGKRVYDMIMNIEHLENDEELESFINQNIIKLNIYRSVNQDRIKRMYPFAYEEQPSINFVKAQGDFTLLQSKNEKHVKTKTYPKKAA